MSMATLVRTAWGPAPGDFRNEFHGADRAKVFSPSRPIQSRQPFFVTQDGARTALDSAKRGS
jgi:hypothetical protein